MSTEIEIFGTDIAHKSDYVLSSTGDLDAISGIQNLKNALFHRLVTTPGTLIHRPNYGVGVYDFQNAINSLDVQRKLALIIQEQFEQDPRVISVLGVAVSYADEQPGLVTIKVRIQPLGYDSVSFNFNVRGLF